MTQLITNTLIVEKINLGDEIDLRGVDGAVTFKVTQLDAKRAKLEHEKYVMWLVKQEDGWYYDHTLRERKLRGAKVYDN